MKLVKCDKCGEVVEAERAGTFKLYLGSTFVRQQDWCTKCSGVDFTKYKPPVPQSNCEIIMEVLIEELAERGVQMEE